MPSFIPLVSRLLLVSVSCSLSSSFYAPSRFPFARSRIFKIAASVFPSFNFQTHKHGPTTHATECWAYLHFNFFFEMPCRFLQFTQRGFVVGASDDAFIEKPSWLRSLSNSTQHFRPSPDQRHSKDPGHRTLLQTCIVYYIT